MTNPAKPATGWAIIGDGIVCVEVLRNRKYDRTVLVRIEGDQRGIPKLALFRAKEDAIDALERMRDTPEYAKRKAEELERQDHHPKPPEPLEGKEL